MKGHLGYLISAEFELQKGTVITGKQPTDFDQSLENILIEKLIPDGLHNYSTDAFSFRSMSPLNSTALARRVQKFNDSNPSIHGHYLKGYQSPFELGCFLSQTGFCQNVQKLCMVNCKTLESQKKSDSQAKSKDQTAELNEDKTDSNEHSGRGS